VAIATPNITEAAVPFLVLATIKANPPKPQNPKTPWLVSMLN
jgi:hypothetical protein